MAIKDLKRMMGNKNVEFCNSLCELTGGGLKRGWAKFRTKAYVWASAAIFGSCYAAA
jgi:hypothetical protein